MHRYQIFYVGQHGYQGSITTAAGPVLKHTDLPQLAHAIDELPAVQQYAPVIITGIWKWEEAE